MDKNRESQLFDHLFRQRPLRDWLGEQLQRQVDVLLANPHHDVILKAQGAAAFIKSFQDRLASAEAAHTRSTT